ncbi:hypothetical protein LX64_00278 [Chitinophaga skermanii]|uniref:Uncharacterized protein n=1 Tax=Chitinophaga skermanii TaxID=331697 RepID=A0A327R3Z4_9BACT|nr:hypothetical protein [Chitinophaga skermanii]RAJ10672.1 hypothetical protein LX64_00278 [Chitinophaga skermanii]
MDDKHIEKKVDDIIAKAKVLGTFINKDELDGEIVLLWSSQLERRNKQRNLKSY